MLHFGHLSVRGAARLRARPDTGSGGHGNRWEKLGRLDRGGRHLDPALLDRILHLVGSHLLVLDVLHRRAQLALSDCDAGHFGRGRHRLDVRAAVDDREPQADDLYPKALGGFVGQVLYQKLLADALGPFGTFLLLSTVYTCALLFVVTKDIGAEFEKIMANIAAWKAARASKKAALLDERLKRKDDRAKQRAEITAALSTPPRRLPLDRRAPRRSSSQGLATTPFHAFRKEGAPLRPNLFPFPGRTGFPRPQSRSQKSS